MRRHKRPTDAPEVGQHHGGSFHVYMAHKRAKLRNKFEEIAALSSSSENNTSKIFDDVVVYINGYTQPSFDELKLLLGQHGGVVEHYLSKTTCTHIVAANLPDTKVKEMLNEKKPLPAVLPNWIIDSISAGKRLPESDYLLPQFQNRGRASRNVATFFHADHVPSANFDLEQTSDTNQHIQNVTDKPSTDLEMLPAIDMRRSHGFRDEAYKNMRSSLTDTDFVRSYFSSSRLHLIGSWREFVQSIVRTAQRISRETPRQMDGERTIVHIDLDCFFVQVSLLKQPQELWSVPIAISHSSVGPKHKTTDITDNDSKQRQFNTSVQRTDTSDGGFPNSSKNSNATTPGFSAAEISSANYFARIYGVKASMFVGYAQHLCPELTVLPYDFDGIKRVSSNVYRTLTSYFSGPTFGHLFSLSSTELGTSSFGSQQNYQGLPQYLSEVRDALQNYEKWKEVINTIEATSCDEAYLDISGCKDPSSFVQHLRAAIYAATGCTCSAGIGPNKLLARLATRDAKQSKIDAAKYLQQEKPSQDPTSQSQTFDTSHQEIQSVQHSEHIMFSPVSREGVVLIPNNQAHVAAKLRNLPVERMPGIGWKTKNVLSDNGINTVADALEIPKSRLETILGKQTGKLLYNAIRGIDLEQGLQELGDRKSVGADINWGVRFQKQDDALHFIRQLCCEVFTRLRRAAFLDTGKDVPNDIFFQHLATSNDINGDPVNLVGEPYFVVSAVSLRVKKRQPGAPPPGKPLGCGACDNFSKSAQLNRGLTSNDLHRFISITIELYKALNLEVTEIRGVGIQLSKLRLFDASGQLVTMSSIESEEGSSYNIQNMWERMKSVNRQQRSPTNSQNVSSETDAPHTFDRRQRDPMTSITSNIERPMTNTRTNSQNDFFLTIPATEIDPSVWSSLPGNVRQEISTSIQANRRPGMLDHFQLSQPSPMGRRTDRGPSKTHVPAKAIKNTSKRAHSMGGQTSLEDYRLLYEFRRRVIENGHANDNQASSSDVITLSTQQDTSPPQTYEGGESVRSYRQYSPTSSPLLSQTQRKGRLLSQQLSGKREHNTLSHNIRSSVKHPPIICLELDSSSDSEQTPSKNHSRSSGSDQTPSKTHSRSSDIPIQRAEEQKNTTSQVNDLIGASSSDVDPEWFAALPAKVQIQVVRDIHKKHQQSRSFLQDVPSVVSQTRKHDLKPQDQPITNRQYIPELHGMMSPTNPNMVCFLREMPALDLPIDQPKLLEDFAATIRTWSIAIQQSESIKDRSVSETRCMLIILQLLADWRTDDIHMCLRYLQRMRNQYSHMSTLFQRVEMFARSTCQDYLGFRLDIS